MRFFPPSPSFPGVSDGVHHPSVPRRVPSQLPHQLPGGLRRAPARRQRQEHRHLPHRQACTVCDKVCKLCDLVLNRKPLTNLAPYPGPS